MKFVNVSLGFWILEIPTIISSRAFQTIRMCVLLVTEAALLAVALHARSPTMEEYE
jgi:hypothetical protein